MIERGRSAAPTRGREKPKRVRLLEIDEELAETIPPAELEIARRHLVAPVHCFEPGDESVPDLAPPETPGLLITEGFLTRDVGFAGAMSRELLGAGDLLRPSDVERDFLPPFSEASFTVMEPTTVAILDERHLKVGARWPRFIDELLRRATYRSRWLAIRLAISGTVRIDERLLLFAWHTAGRWGKVTPDGVALPFRLTHETLASLIGAQRPSVTSALSSLRADGRLAFEKDLDGETRIVLLGEPPTKDEITK